MNSICKRDFVLWVGIVAFFLEQNVKRTSPGEESIGLSSYNYQVWHMRGVLLETENYQK